MAARELFYFPRANRSDRGRNWWPFGSSYVDVTRSTREERTVAKAKVSSNVPGRESLSLMQPYHVAIDHSLEVINGAGFGNRRLESVVDRSSAARSITIDAEAVVLTTRLLLASKTCRRVVSIFPRKHRFRREREREREKPRRLATLVARDRFVKSQRFRSARNLIRVQASSRFEKSVAISTRERERKLCERKFPRVKFNRPARRRPLRRGVDQLIQLSIHRVAAFIRISSTRCFDGWKFHVACLRDRDARPNF